MINFEIIQLNEEMIASYIDGNKTNATYNRIEIIDGRLIIAANNNAGEVCSIRFIVDEDFLRELKLLVTVIDQSMKIPF